MVDFEVYGSTDQPSSNLLPAGRYQFTVLEIDKFSSKKGNPCVKVKIDVEGYHLTDIICIAEKLDWRWRQFLYAIGIRRSSKYFKVANTEIIGKTAMVDIVQRDRELEDGSTVPENRIRMYSSIEEQVAPVKGIEPEVGIETEIELKTESKQVEPEQVKPKRVKQVKPQTGEYEL